MAKRNPQPTDISDSVREKLTSAGISADVARRITAFICAYPNKNGSHDEMLNMGYPVTKKGFTRLKQAIIMGMPTGGIDRTIADRTALATFLDQGMRGTPPTQRLELPAWVAEESQADRREELMRRAKSLSLSAARAQEAASKMPKL